MENSNPRHLAYPLPVSLTAIHNQNQTIFSPILNHDDLKLLNYPGEINRNQSAARMIQTQMLSQLWLNVDHHSNCTRSSHMRSGEESAQCVPEKIDLGERCKNGGPLVAFRSQSTHRRHPLVVSTKAENLVTVVRYFKFTTNWTFCNWVPLVKS